MSYKIVITESRRMTHVTKEWVKIADVGNPSGNGPQYAYGPPVERATSTTRDVLTQEVDDLDLAAVIKAINKL